MKTRIKKDRRGFTIIEVALVLAIAGLIFLMVFVALPALQRSQRDAQRRNDISLLLTKIMNFQTNNRGALPTGTLSSQQAITAERDGNIYSNGTWQYFYNEYFDDNFRDPRSGESYILKITLCGASNSGNPCIKEYNHAVTQGPGYTEHDLKQETKNKIHINVGATCNGQAAVQSNNPRKVAAQYFLESGWVQCSNT